MILIAEDNKTLRDLMVKQFSRLGYKTITVACGDEAVEECMKHPVNLVFMDLNMPEVGGIEATKKIREIERREGLEPLPIIAMTAAEGNKQECLEAGMNAYYQKPLLLDLLSGIIRKWHRKPHT